MNPYEVLGVTKKATLKEIKGRYRGLSSMHHPDKQTGNREKFEEVKLAYDILSNPDRRARYDTTGRVDDDPITPQRIRAFLENLIEQVVNAQRPNGSTDDPVWDNIRDKILMSIAASRIPLTNERFNLDRKLERCQRLIERFKPNQEDDIIGDILKAERKKIEQDIRYNEDAMQLSREGERVFKNYDYEVGPGPEGHISPGPTRRSRGPLWITSDPR